MTMMAVKAPSFLKRHFPVMQAPRHLHAQNWPEDLSVPSRTTLQIELHSFDLLLAVAVELALASASGYIHVFLKLPVLLEQISIDI